MITPETSEERIKQLDSYSSGFIYLVSSNSITGSTNAITFQTDYYRRIQNMKLKNPHLIGFGVHDKKTFETVCEFGSGAIIGSAFIKHLKNKGTSKELIEGFVKSIKE